MVRKTHGLCHLQVGESRKDHVDVFFCQGQEGGLQVVQQQENQIDFCAEPQAHIGCHLIVSRSGGVQSLARIANQLSEPGLDVQVHIL